MTKLMFVTLGGLVLIGVVLMVSVSPGVRGTSSAGQDATEIRALERSMDLKALPKSDLDPAVYQ